jgi:hypothetical protein
MTNWKSKRKRPLSETRRRVENNIKGDLKGINCETDSGWDLLSRVFERVNDVSDSVNAGNLLTI